MPANDDDTDPWADLVEMAQAIVKKAEAGKSQDARQVLKQAAVALRDVLGGRLPDRERIEYLRYLLRALDMIADRIKPARALGLEENNRPSMVSPYRDTLLFLAVGLEFDKRKNVRESVTRVATRYGNGVPTVRKAWQSGGGHRGWKRCKEE